MAIANFVYRVTRTLAIEQKKSHPFTRISSTFRFVRFFREWRVKNHPRAK